MTLELIWGWASEGGVALAAWVARHWSVCGVALGLEELVLGLGGAALW